MNQQDLEKHIRTELQQHESAVNPTAIWDQIEDRVPKKKKRRIFGWWFFLGMGLLLGLGWLSYQLIAPANGTGASTAIAEKQVENITNLPEEQPTIESAEMASAPSTDDQTKPTNPKENSSLLSNNNKKTTPPTVVDPRRSSLFFDTKKGSSQEEHLALKGQHDAENFVEKSPQEEVSIADEAPSSILLPNTTSSSADRFALLDPLFGIDAEVAYPVSWPLQLEEPTAFDLSTPIRRNKKTARWAIGVEGGISRLTRTLEASDSLSDTYRGLRQASEELLEAVQGEIQLQYELPVGLYFRTGLNYTRINEKFEHAFTEVENDTLVDGIQEIYIDANGDSSMVIGSVPFTRTTSYKKRTYNSLTMLDIPLIAGYRLGSEKWGLLAEAGAYFNINLQSEGNIAAPDGSLLDLEDSEQDIFRTNLGLSYHLGLGVDYHITPQLSLGAKARFRFFPKDFTTANYSLEQRYTLIGLNLGLKYYLN